MDGKPISKDEPIKAEIVLYQNAGHDVPLEVRYLDETFWLTQKEMADLFDTTPSNISMHLKNIFEEGELSEADALIKFRISEFNKKPTNFYNLDAIIAVGYRVNSMKATQFRQWATKTLREYITKGFVLNDEMLKNGAPFGKDYFDELLARIRDIRASERRMWLKVTDIFQECSFDYDKNSPVARNFFASVQNKMHYAALGHTAAEIVDSRADASKPHMGLTSWKDSPDGRIHSSDVSIAKNYLDEDEITRLNRLVNRFLDDLESRAEDGILTSMQDCSEALDDFLRYSRRDVLKTKGQISHGRAEKKALEEFSRYQEIQDESYENDFQEFAKAIDPSSVQGGAE